MMSTSTLQEDKGEIKMSKRLSTSSRGTAIKERETDEMRRYAARYNIFDATYYCVIIPDDALFEGM